MKLILASTSPYRRQLLERLGIPFCCMAPRIDEESLKDPAWSPRETAERLAIAKVESLRELESTAVLIGSDQVATCQGQIFGKPVTAERAVEQIEILAGRTHELITSLCVVTGQQRRTHTDVTRLTMRPLERREIERYVAADRPLDCAGAYKLEQRGIALFEKIESADHTAIVGLPLMTLVTILRQLGFELP